MSEQEPHPPPNDLCSICHGTFQIPCQANCSHWFCANCILLVWRHTSGIQPCKCPLCRRPINILVPTNDINNEDSQQILSEIQIYNRTFGLQSDAPIAQRILDLPFLLRRLFRDFVFSDNSLPLVLKARIYLSVSFLSYSTDSLIDCCCLDLKFNGTKFGRVFIYEARISRTQPRH